MNYIIFTSNSIERIFHRLLQHHEALTIICLLFYFALFFKCVISHQTLKYNKLELPFAVFDLESIVFNCNGEGPYTGTSNGRILKWQGFEHGRKEFAITSPFR